MSKRNFQKNDKYKYFVAVLYPESMVDDWEDNIAFLLQKPYAYCIHDKDKTGHDGDRKVHVHVMVAYNNNTTVNSAIKLFKNLQPSCNYCEPCDVSYMFNYLIHDTDDCKKKNKYLYDVSERVLGNNFDIGMYEVLSVRDKNERLKEFCDYIIQNRIDNFTDFYFQLCYGEDIVATDFDIIKNNSGFLERLCKGYFYKHKK